ncbi:uncharacterized protein NFIA_028650 [Aspergillus fischeri NRRL 181]|uniref:Uncharacterized protein n=1 Tax=Neosartorya fischeri (strain ATCC 1020 / DSM 3700 / CBS 544.65 / FGSC A1164 / JCM 1740 / NRRL 181 / WB 181) TaxID=331117 RepID=A1D9F3_NEOFI|nr:uncharacterized protein NFIA_028650 [Aspergillus fischeri NRRL 181]EAW20434.1 hypothetical protein NFIA_028650 [Aspergillus fischeri NRRL 181]
MVVLQSAIACRRGDFIRDQYDKNAYRKWSDIQLTVRGLANPDSIINDVYGSIILWFTKSHK